MASAKTKNVNGKPDKINELILKTKADLKETLIAYNSHPWIIVLLINRLSFGEGEGLFEIGRPRSREWKDFWT